MGKFSVTFLFCLVFFCDLLYWQSYRRPIYFLYQKKCVSTVSVFIGNYCSCMSVSFVNLCFDDVSSHKSLL